MSIVCSNSLTWVAHQYVCVCVAGYHFRYGDIVLIEKLAAKVPSWYHHEFHHGYCTIHVQEPLSSLLRHLLQVHQKDH